MLRDHGIQLQRRRSWCISTDPEFAQKAADVVGLYLDPPDNALVLCVDEKPHMQALERAQGYLKMPNGRALTGFSHEYRRHGATTLFAALETATGQVIAGHYQRRRRASSELRLIMARRTAYMRMLTLQRQKTDGGTISGFDVDQGISHFSRFLPLTRSSV